MAFGLALITFQLCKSEHNQPLQEEDLRVWLCNAGSLPVTWVLCEHSQQASFVAMMPSRRLLARRPWLETLRLRRPELRGSHEWKGTTSHRGSHRGQDMVAATRNLEVAGHFA